MYGSHAYTIPKTTDIWNTFIAEIEKGHRLEGFRAKQTLSQKVRALDEGPLLSLIYLTLGRSIQVSNYASEMSSAPHVNKTRWTIEERRNVSAYASFATMKRRTYVFFLCDEVGGPAYDFRYRPADREAVSQLVSRSGPAFRSRLEGNPPLFRRTSSFEDTRDVRADGSIWKQETQTRRQRRRRAELA